MVIGIGQCVDEWIEDAVNDWRQDPWDCCRRHYIKILIESIVKTNIRHKDEDATGIEYSPAQDK